jgi:hypothetical protein
MATGLTYAKIKDNSRRKGIPAQKKAARRAEAEIRAAEYAKLTPKQKLAKLDSGGFRAEKQRSRLVLEIANIQGD